MLGVAGFNDFIFVRVERDWVFFIRKCLILSKTVIFYKGWGTKSIGGVVGFFYKGLGPVNICTIVYISIVTISYFITRFYNNLIIFVSYNFLCYTSC